MEPVLMVVMDMPAWHELGDLDQQLESDTKLCPVIEGCCINLHIFYIYYNYRWSFIRFFSLYIPYFLSNFPHLPHSLSFFSLLGLTSPFFSEFCVIVGLPRFSLFTRRCDSRSCSFVESGLKASHARHQSHPECLHYRCMASRYLSSVPVISSSQR